jgi:hypothetical protein
MSRPSPSIVLAILALVFAVTGTAFAATKVLIRSSKQIATGAALCRLNAAGDKDVAIGTVQTPGTAGPVTLQMQLTRTIDKPGDATLTCNVGDVAWQASDTSIIAMKLVRSSRTDVTG